MGKDDDTGKRPVTPDGMPDEEHHVPEAEERFEHTLRRLMIEKEKARSKHPELYR